MNELPLNVILGLQAFNQRDFFAAHEFFEAAWRETSTQPREFFRALIMLSGGYFRLTQDRPDAALKFFDRALGWIDQYPRPYLGMDTEDIKNQLRKLITAIHSGASGDAVLNQNTFQLSWDDQEKLP